MFRRSTETTNAHSLRDVTVRLADREDARALRRLAELDSAIAPIGPVVVAQSEGEILAAVPVAGGPAIADPFRRTAALVEMLELRAGQLRPQRPAAAPRSVCARLAGSIRGGSVPSLR